MSKELEDILDAGQPDEIGNNNFMDLLNVSNTSVIHENKLSPKSNEAESQVSGKKMESLNSKEKDSNVEGNNQLNQAIIEYKDDDQNIEMGKPQPINFCDELETQAKKPQTKVEGYVDIEKVQPKCYCPKCIIL